MILIRQLLYASVDMIAAAIPLIPMMILLNRAKFHNGKRTAVYTLLALYLGTMGALVGLPNVAYVRLGGNFNLIPFRGMIADLRNGMLNVLLFVPLGIFLPCLWQKFRSLKAIALEGFWISLVIEVLQIFTYRATDVNDLIHNTLGAVLGYGISRLLTRNHPGAENSRERFWVYGAVAVAAFFIQPLIANFFWSII